MAIGEDCQPWAILRTKKDLRNTASFTAHLILQKPKSQKKTPSPTGAILSQKAIQSGAKEAAVNDTKCRDLRPWPGKRKEMQIRRGLGSKNCFNGFICFGVGCYGLFVFWQISMVFEPMFGSHAHISLKFSSYANMCMAIE